MGRERAGGAAGRPGPGEGLRSGRAARARRGLDERTSDAGWEKAEGAVGQQGAGAKAGGAVGRKQAGIEPEERTKGGGLAGEATGQRLAGRSGGNNAAARRSSRENRA